MFERLYYHRFIYERWCVPPPYGGGKEATSLSILHTLTNQIHDYRLQKIQHTNIFSRESILFYRKRRYVCGCCKKRFYEKNELVDRYQRQSKEFKQSIALELIHGKSFKDVADRFHTSTSTVIRRFDTINADMLKEPKQLPSVI